MNDQNPNSKGNKINLQRGCFAGIGCLAMLFGAFVTLFAWGFGTMVDPDLEGREYWAAVYRMMVPSGFCMAALGLLGMAAGFAVIVHMVDSDLTERLETTAIILLIVFTILSIVAIVVSLFG